MKKLRLLLALALFIGAVLLLSACDLSGLGGSVTTAATTTTAPVTTTTCAVHTWDDGFTTRAPSCTEEGIRRYLCTRCPAHRDEPIPCTEHTYSSSWTADADGHWHAATCSCRGKADEAEHSFDEGRLTRPASCAEEGIFTYTCTVCNFTRTELIPCLPHIYSEEWTVGDGAHWHDAICGCPFVSRADLAAHSFDEGAVTKPATCAEGGVLVKSCTVCSGTKEFPIPETEDHSYTITVTEPTCTAKGYTEYACSICGKTYKDSYTDKIAHTYEPTVTAPTCLAEGYTTYTCTGCGDRYKDDYTDMLAHAYKTTVIAPTCTARGYDLHKCKGCPKSYKDNYTDTIPHAYEATVKESTCTAEGYTFHKCTVCGDNYKDSYTDKLPHDWSLTGETAATCAAHGYKYFVCLGCGTTSSSSLDKLPHAYETAVIEPTCTAEGYTLHTCTACGDNYKDNTVAMLSHSYVDLVCTGCRKKEYSFDLEYTPSGDGAYYTITGIGTCEDTELVFPHTHGGIPVRGIADSAFAGNTDIISFSFLVGDTPLTIGERAFSGCTSLKNLGVGRGVSSIGAFAFENCTNLRFSMTIGEQVTFIGEGAFAGCTAVEYFNVPVSNPVYHADGRCLIETATKSVVAGCKMSTIPEDGSVTRIASYAFYGCTELSTFYIPKSVEYIGKYAFTGCTSLTSVELEWYGGWYINRVTGIYLGGTTSFWGPEDVAKKLTKTYDDMCWYREGVS